MDTEAIRERLDEFRREDGNHGVADMVYMVTRDVPALLAEVDRLRELLVAAEGYALASGADRPFVSIYPEGTPHAEAIERAGCYPRDARREHPGPFALNPPSTNWPRWPLA